MKTIAYIIIMTLFIGINSCNEDDEQTFIELTERLSYFDNQGNNLLNPEFAGSYLPENIHVYRLRNGYKKFQNYIIAFDDRTNQYFLQTSFELENTQYYIELSPTDTDTVSVTISHWGSSMAIGKVFYNDNELSKETEIIYYSIIK